MIKATTINSANASAVFSKVFEETGPDGTLSIKKIYLSLLPDEDLAVEAVSSFISGLDLASRLVSSKKRYLKGEEKILSGQTTLVPAETAYDEDISGLLEATKSNSNLLYICYNQQVTLQGLACGATPAGARTKSSPVGTKNKGCSSAEKNINEILLSAGCKYLAQASIFYKDDFQTKLKKALSLNGFRFINVLTPSIVFWGYDLEKTEELGKLAVETGYWPIYEFDNGHGMITVQPKQLEPLGSFFALQKRFQHLILPGNRKLLGALQEEVNRRWEELVKRCS